MSEQNQVDWDAIARKGQERYEEGSRKRARERKAAKAKPPRWVRGKYIPAFPDAWAQKAIRLPGKAYGVLTVLWRLSKCRKSLVVSLSLEDLAPYGLTRWDRYRSLKRLQKAKLVWVKYRRNQDPIVTILTEP